MDYVNYNQNVMEKLKNIEMFEAVWNEQNISY